MSVRLNLATRVQERARRRRSAQLAQAAVPAAYHHVNRRILRAADAGGAVGARRNAECLLEQAAGVAFAGEAKHRCEIGEGLMVEGAIVQPFAQLLQPALLQKARNAAA